MHQGRQTIFGDRLEYSKGIPILQEEYFIWIPNFLQLGLIFLIASRTSGLSFDIKKRRNRNKGRFKSLIYSLECISVAISEFLGAPNEWMETTRATHQPWSKYPSSGGLRILMLGGGKSFAEATTNFRFSTICIQIYELK